MTNDPISDFIIRLKNAGNVGHSKVILPYSNFKHAVASVLLKGGYITAYAKKKKKDFPVLEVELAYVGGAPRIKGVKRLSKPGKRLYMRAVDIRPVRHGYGTLILSTPKGILTGDDARKEKVGGEALFTIW